MNIGLMASRVAKFASDNSPAILTAVGVVGTLTTAYLTGKAAFKAAQILDDRETEIIRDDDKPLSSQEKVYLTWKLFVPPAVAAGMTIACIIGANRIDARRASALVAAYAISERAIDDYKQKVVEKFGKGKEQSVRDEVAQDYVTKNPPKPEMMAWQENGKTQLCCDLFTGRYFFGDVETIRRSENDINYQILKSDYASLSDFYHRVGLDSTSMSDDFGWNTEHPLEIRISSALTPLGNSCVTFEFTVIPIRGYARLQ